MCVGQDVIWMGYLLGEKHIRLGMEQEWTNRNEREESLRGLPVVLLGASFCICMIPHHNV